MGDQKKNRQIDSTVNHDVSDRVRRKVKKVFTSFRTSNKGDNEPFDSMQDRELPSQSTTSDNVITAEQSEKSEALSSSSRSLPTKRDVQGTFPKEQLKEANKFSRKNPINTQNLSILDIQGEHFVLEKASRKTLGIDEKGNKLPGYLGSGIEATVKLGYQSGTNIPVAVKIYNLSEDPEEQEDQIKRIQYSENIERKLGQIITSAVRKKTDLHGQPTGAAKYYKVMKLAPGKEFAAYLEDRYDSLESSTVTQSINSVTRDKQKEILNLVLNLLDTTKKMHHKGIIHGDINPHNIYWDEKNQKFTFIDFGRGCDISTFQNEVPKVPAHVFDNKKEDHYTAPELRISRQEEDLSENWERKITTAADVYSLGWMFKNYFMIDPDYFLDSVELQEIKRFVKHSMLAENKDDRPSIEESIDFIKKKLELFDKNSQTQASTTNNSDASINNDISATVDVRQKTPSPDTLLATVIAPRERMQKLSTEPSNLVKPSKSPQGVLDPFVDLFASTQRDVIVEDEVKKGVIVDTTIRAPLPPKQASILDLKKLPTRNNTSPQVPKNLNRDKKRIFPTVREIIKDSTPYNGAEKRPLEFLKVNKVEPKRDSIKAPEDHSDDNIAEQSAIIMSKDKETKELGRATIQDYGSNLYPAATVVALRDFHDGGANKQTKAQGDDGISDQKAQRHEGKRRR